jgi:nicotinate phosphoribosyltransferase
VHALHEGDEISPRETVLTIEGDYSLFAHLETVYLGCLARRSLIMRNVAEVVQAARGKPIFYFPARHDHWLVQTGDGWAAHVAGAIGVSTDAQASWWGGRGIGTVPHGLIAAYGGDTVKAARKFAERFHEEMNITVLVDFENDSVPDRARGRRGARARPVGRAARHLRAARRPLAVMTRWAASTHAASTRGWSRRSAARSTAPASATSRSSPAGGFTPSGSREFEAAGVPSTPTASARR